PHYLRREWRPLGPRRAAGRRPLGTRGARAGPGNFAPGAAGAHRAHAVPDGLHPENDRAPVGGGRGEQPRRAGAGPWSVFRALIRRSTSVVALLAIGAFVAQAAPPAPLLTPAEASDYRATSGYAQVMAFCRELAKRAPLVRLAELGRSAEGRPLPLLILSDPPVASPEEAARSGKPVLFALGNIHAGEVDGKEALLMLAREL